MIKPPSSRTRLIAALRHERPDRVPVTLYELDPYSDSQWQAADPTYDRVRAAARELQDTISFARLPLGPFLSDPNSENVPGAPRTKEWIEDGARFSEVRLSTPSGRVLTSISRENPGVHSAWRIKSFVEDEDDLDAFLEIPSTSAELNLTEVEANERKLGENGLVLFSLGDPLGVALGVIPFDLFAMWSATELDRRKIRRLLDAMHERTHALVASLAACSTGRVFRFWGPEYAGPSLLPPTRFREYVVDYLADLIQLVRRSGNFAVVHCHARLNSILDMIAEMEPDGLEPIECAPAPSADVTLADVKRRIGDRICLMGNVQGPLLETGSAEEVEQAVRTAIDEGAGGGGFILMPTAMPITSLDPRAEANILRMLSAGHRFGDYEGRP